MLFASRACNLSSPSSFAFSWPISLSLDLSDYAFFYLATWPTLSENSFLSSFVFTLPSKPPRMQQPVDVSPISSEQAG